MLPNCCNLRACFAELPLRPMTIIISKIIRIFRRSEVTFEALYFPFAGFREGDRLSRLLTSSC